MILELEQVSVSYQGNTAVENVSFSVEENDYFCIVGANGSGKSSIIKAILGLVSLSGGRINCLLRQDEIAYLPQIVTIPLGFPATVREVVMSGTQKPAYRLPFYTKSDVSVAYDAMGLLGISEYAGAAIGDLSGGLRQRALLARALCRKPKLLVLDEPLTGLDECISQSLYSLLADLNNKKATAILMVSHDYDRVAEYSKHMAVIDKSLVFFGDTSQWVSYRQECAHV